MTDRLDTPEQREALRLLRSREWPADMTLLSACRAVHEAKNDVLDAIERAETAREAMEIVHVCEEFFKAFDFLSTRALRKAERL